MTIFLDVPPEECIKRITFERERYELFETYQNLKVVYENFKRLIKEHLFNVVEIPGMTNGSPRPVSDVKNDILSVVMPVIEEDSQSHRRGPKARTEDMIRVDSFLKGEQQ